MNTYGSHNQGIGCPFYEQTVIIALFLNLQLIPIHTFFQNASESILSKFCDVFIASLFLYLKFIAFLGNLFYFVILVCSMYTIFYSGTWCMDCLEVCSFVSAAKIRSALSVGYVVC